MTRESRHEKKRDAEIMLGLLDAVERNGDRSQRRLAAELNIALGLLNTYLAGCIKKGLVKARQVPARRYFYYLTPRGFAEKSKLTLEFLSSSFGFFREAKQDCFDLFDHAREGGMTRLILAGGSDLAEVAALCATDRGIKIVGIVDPAGGTFLGMPVQRSFSSLAVEFDAVMITDLVATPKTVAEALLRFGSRRVLVPNLLRGRIRPGRAA